MSWQPAIKFSKIRNKNKCVLGRSHPLIYVPTCWYRMKKVSECYLDDPLTVGGHNYTGTLQETNTVDGMPHVNVTGLPNEHD